MVINKDNYIGVYNMTTEKIKRMLDACYQAKRIRELLPPLPQGVGVLCLFRGSGLEKAEEPSL